MLVLVLVLNINIHILVIYFVIQAYHILRYAIEQSTNACPCMQCAFSAVDFSCLAWRPASEGPVACLTRWTKLVVDLSIPDCGEDTSINEPKSIPFSRTLRLEVPPDPSLRRRLKCTDLRFNVAPGLVLVRRGPLGDVVSPATVADPGVVQVCSIVAGTTIEAIEVFCAVTNVQSAHVFFARRHNGRAYVMADVHSPTIRTHISQ